VEAKRRPFDWVKTDRKHLRSSLRRIASAVRHGWLDGVGLADRRAVLIAALEDLANQDLTGRELIALASLHASMMRANLDGQLAARQGPASTRGGPRHQHSRPRSVMARAMADRSEAAGKEGLTVSLSSFPATTRTT